MAKKRLFILGAGASYAAGLPDANRVMHQLMAYSVGPWQETPGRTPFALTGQLLTHLVRLMKKAGFAKGDRYPLEKVIILLLEEVKQDARQYWIFELLIRTVSEQFYSRSCTQHKTYVPFAKALQRHDVVITFNWDLCLEVALHSLSKAFGRLTNPGTKPGPLIAKPHGSIDYFVLPHEPWDQYHYLEYLTGGITGLVGNEGEPEYDIVRLKTFDNERPITVQWNGTEVVLEFVEASEKSFDPSKGDVSPMQGVHLLNRAPAFLLVPEMNPAMYEWSYQRLKESIEPFLPAIEEVFIIGYSFPDYDRHVLALLSEIIGRCKTPLMHVVNPAVDDSMRRKVESRFGECEYHNCRFQDMKWK